LAKAPSSTAFGSSWWHPTTTIGGSAPRPTHWVQRLPFNSGGPSTLVGVDQGLGHEGLPVVGLTFPLRASGSGDAARLAVATATVAGVDAGITGRVDDVVLVLEDTLVLPVSERTIPMPD
jgi:hypothetical protein